MNNPNFYLDGENAAPKTVSEARALIGKRIRYLRASDIDRSGRGYYFPRVGVVTDANGRNMAVDGSFYLINSFVEVQVLKESA